MNIPLLNITVQPDIVAMLVLAALLFWSLLWTSKQVQFSGFFLDSFGKPSIHRLLGAYLTISYTVYAGYVSLTSKTLPDFPWVVAILISALLGLVTIKEGLYIWKNGQLPPQSGPEVKQ